MTTFDDRQKAFESQYARDQEMQFKIVARPIACSACGPPRKWGSPT